jgi:hypothetical protein
MNATATIHVPAHQLNPSHGEHVDTLPDSFDVTTDHRWVLPDGSWVDYDQTSGDLTHYVPRSQS